MHFMPLRQISQSSSQPILTQVISESNCVIWTIAKLENCDGGGGGGEYIVISLTAHKQKKYRWL